MRRPDALTIHADGMVEKGIYSERPLLLDHSCGTTVHYDHPERFTAREKCQIRSRLIGVKAVREVMES